MPIPQQRTPEPAPADQAALDTMLAEFASPPDLEQQWLDAAAELGQLDGDDDER